MSITLNQAYQLFIADRETSCVEETIRYYKENLMSFFLYCQDCLNCPYKEIPLDAITRELFANYIKDLRTRPKYQKHPFLEASEEGLANTSIRTYARAIKAFSHYCQDFGYCEDFTHHVKLPREDPKDIIPLYTSEVQTIDKLFNLRTEFGIRNWCIFHLMLDAGLRSSEVVELRFTDLIFEKNVLRVYKGKGAKTRLVIMCPRLKTNLLKYCIVYRNYEKLSPSTPVFLQMKKQESINLNVIKQLFSRLKKRSEITRLHPHLLRHTFATSYVLGGGNLEMLRLLLGHYDYDVTKMYLHLAQQFQLLHSDIYRLDPVFFRKYD